MNSVHGHPVLVAESGRGCQGYVVRGYPFNAGQLEDGHRDLKCRKARPRRLQLRKPEALMLQSVPPYVDTLVRKRGCYCPCMGHLPDMAWVLWVAIWQRWWVAPMPCWRMGLAAAVSVPDTPCRLPARCGMARGWNVVWLRGGEDSDGLDGAGERLKVATE